VLTKEHESQELFTRELTGKFFIDANTDELILIQQHTTGAKLVKVEGMQQLY